MQSKFHGYLVLGFKWFYRVHRDLDIVPTAEYSDFRLLDGFIFFRLTRLHINVRIFFRYTRISTN